MNEIEFIRGQRDCKQGNPHKPNQHPDYDRGYSAEYTCEQNVTEMSRLQNSFNQTIYNTRTL